MKKIFVAAAALAFVALPKAGAQEAAARFVDGLAVEGHLLGACSPCGNNKSLACLFGAGAGAEWTLPLQFDPVDVGVSLRAEWLQFIPKSGSALTGGFDIRAYPGIFARFPFKLGKMNFALQPEFFYGVAMKFPKSNDGSGIKSFYANQVLGMAADLRMSLSKAERLELSFAPMAIMELEKNASVFELGLRAGVVWHFAKKRAANNIEAVEPLETAPAAAAEPALESEPAPTVAPEVPPEPEVETTPEVPPEAAPELEPAPVPQVEEETEPTLEPEPETKPETIEKTEGNVLPEEEE